MYVYARMRCEHINISGHLTSLIDRNVETVWFTELFNSAMEKGQVGISREQIGNPMNRFYTKYNVSKENVNYEKFVNKENILRAK